MAREKQKKNAEPKAPAEQSEPRYNGPWYRVEANALHSPTYSGLVDLGTYTEPERKKGAITKRIERLKAEGYQNINVREVTER